MNTGYNEAITIDQVISSAKADLGIMDNNSYDVVLEKWINEGVRHLGTNQLFVKRPVILTIQDNRATLPAGFRRFLGMRFKSQIELINQDGSSSGRTACLPLLYLDTSFLNQCGCDTSNQSILTPYIGSFEFIGNEILFRGNIPDGTEVELSYMGFWVNDDCMLLIRPDFERALSAYSRMKFLQAFHEVKGNFTPMFLREAKGEWQAQKKWVKGLATAQEFQNDKYMMRQLSKAWFILQTIPTN